MPVPMKVLVVVARSYGEENVKYPKKIVDVDIYMEYMNTTTTKFCPVKTAQRISDSHAGSLHLPKDPLIPTLPSSMRSSPEPLTRSPSPGWVYII